DFWCKSLSHILCACENYISFRYHAHTARLIKREARASRTAWAQSMDASDAARSGVIALRTQCQHSRLRSPICGQ
nr:hypothetical protein [Tanacetum cinerariifolium]